MAFEIATRDGYVKHSFTFIRSSFTNLILHKIINETIVPLRVELMRRSEGGSSSILGDSLRTYMLNALQDIGKQIQNHANTATFDPIITLSERISKREETIDRLLSKAVSLEDEVRRIDWTNSDELLGATDPSVHSLTFDWRGVSDLDWAQATPERVDHPIIREVIIALDRFIVEITRSHSADEPRTIIRDEAALWLSDLANIYAVVEEFDPGTRTFHPTSWSLNERQNAFNADGAWDTPAVKGSATSEPINTTRRNFDATVQQDEPPMVIKP